jgi:hypothetical protein
MSNNLDRIDAYCAEATAGPWSVDDTKALGAYGVYCNETEDTMDFVCALVPSGWMPTEETIDRRNAIAHFIASARTDLPALVAECRMLRDLLHRLRDSEGLDCRYGNGDKWEREIDQLLKGTR